MKISPFVLSVSKYLFLGIVAIVSALILSNTTFVIRNLGNSVEQNGRIVNTISTSGSGKVYGRPDMATLVLNLSEKDKTVKSAVEKLNKKLEELYKMLNENNISRDNIKTISFNVYPEYEYSANGGNPVLIGHAASSSIEITIKNVDEKALNVSKIVDSVSAIDRIQISSLSFDIENKKEFFTKAREQALKNARERAEEVARFAGVKLLSPVNIVDNSNENVIQPPYPIPFAMYREVGAGNSSETSSDKSIYTGNMLITVDVNVLWAIE
ncbi:MAG: SIMPL domain-containing protein [Candidatus Dojkabacteria bacterium]|nr:SIMPL domain-containing protein [Candidatus Dojkabacteria bacterium]